MKYLMHILKNNLPIFILILPFELRLVASQAGFKWNSLQAGAWATDDMSVVLHFVKAHINQVIIAQSTLDLFLERGKILEVTHARLSDVLEAFSPDRKTQAAIAAATMSEEKIAAIHQALRNLAAVCDGTLTEDAQGFNRNDVDYGHSLAEKAALTRTDAGYASLMIYKYRRQLGEDLYKIIFPEVFERETRAAQEKADKKNAKAAIAANKKAEKESPKLHKKGQFCEWAGCDACLSARPFIEAIQLPTSSLPEMSYDEIAPGRYEKIIDNFSGLQQIKPNYEQDIDEMNTSHTNTILQASGLPPVSSVAGAPTDTMIFVAGDKPLGYTEIKPGEAPKTVIDPTQMNRVAVVNLSKDQQKAEPEVIKLAVSLIDCFAGDFDTTVDLLRAARKLDEPRKAKTEFLQGAWAASGYQTK